MCLAVEGRERTWSGAEKENDMGATQDLVQRKNNKIYQALVTTSYTISVEATVRERLVVRSQVVTRGKEAPLDHRPLGTQATECRWIEFEECVTDSQGESLLY